jgi:hypothetical protein
MDEIEYVDFDPCMANPFDNSIYMTHSVPSIQSKPMRVKDQPISIESVDRLRTRAVQKPTTSMLRRLDLGQP